MTPDLLRRAGEALYGPVWQLQFSLDFNINSRTLRRWLSGAEAIPAGIACEVYDELGRRVHDAQELRHKIEQIYPEQPPPVVGCRCSMEHAK